MRKELAFVFPGQGSQKIGMLDDIAEYFPLVKDIFFSASQILGYDLWNIVSNDPAEQLNQTLYTQSAMLAADIAIWQIWKSKGGDLPILMAGHSLGEYAALVAAEALSFTDAILLVSKRAQLMQEAVAPGDGAMVVVLGLSSDEVNNVCHAASDESANSLVQAANFNSPGQIVIAGNTLAVEKAMLLAKEAGARRVQKLPVSIPSHCLLMKTAAEQFAKHLENIAMQTPKIPVINNVDVDIKTDPSEIKNSLVRQLYCPVRWIETIEYMGAEKGINTVIECGPGKVLTGLNKRINSELVLYALNSVETFDNFIRGD